MKKAMNQSVLTLILNGISILALIFMVFSIISYSNVSKQLNEDNEKRFNLTYSANRFMNGSSYLTNEVRAYAATGNREHYTNYWNEVNNLKNRDLGVAAMQEIGITAEEQALIDEMSTISNTLVPLEENAMNMVQGGKLQEALDYVYGSQYNESIGKINSLKDQFLEMLDKRTASDIEALSNRADTIEITIIIALVLVGVIQLLNMFVVRLQVLKPVLVIEDQMKEISQGNLSAKFSLESNTSEIGMLVGAIHETKRELKKYIKDIDYKLSQMAQGNMNLAIDSDYRGEFLPIQKAMEQILDSLNKALLQINISAEQVSEEAMRVAQGASVLSNGTVQQASAVEQLSSSIKEISIAVENTSRDADDAKSSSLEAMKHLQVSDSKMKELTAAIQDISKASHQIGGIIKTIQDISFQTNILALNASVEAARAGESGKGFAVVADEVQSLANKSAASAQDITELIENSMRLVDHGAELSDDTTNALQGVVSSAQVASAMIERIADSAMQQSESLKQVRAGMQQISDVVQTNASAAQESAMAANELNDQAEKLKVSIHRFKLRQNMVKR